MLDFDFAAKNHWIVTAEWLSQHLHHPQIRIVDCRFSLANPALGRQQYEAGHLPMAHYLDLNQDLSSPVQRHGGRHPLPQVEPLAQKLSTIGVRSGADATLVIAYDDSRFAFAARLWWLLRYLGHDQVAVLDGGFSGWQAAGYEVTPEQPPRQPGHFIPQVRAGWTVDIEAVKACIDASDAVLIDAREAERYRGEREPIDPIAGHIPGAINYPWQDTTDAQGFALPPALQQQRWQNLPPAKEVMVYCGSGVTACVNLLSLAMAGRGAKLYPGSWSDWCSYL
jgi:thiosulfate/3-mercaptopyruvate sulfurtransferase